MAETGQPIKLIDIDETDEQFEVSGEAMAFLASLPRDKKIKVIAVAGPYRSGKSFLMNRMLDQMKGFEIGSTIESCTKGIWIWNQPVVLPGDEDTVTILMDTEGLHSSERSTDVDLKIFALTVLLSSSFIFNQIGPISEQSLTDLHLISNLVKLFGQKQGNPKEADFDSFPEFFWCLRDFYLDISEDFDDNSKDYMESCLKPVMGVGKDTLKKNAIRKAICNYFPTRECITMIRPVDDEEELVNLENMEYDQLKDEFRGQCDAFIKELKDNSKPKSLKLAGKNKFLNGQMLLNIAMDFCEALNSDDAPKIENSVSRVVQEETRVVQDDSFLELQNTLEEEIVPPIHQDQFDQITKRAKEEAILQLQLKLSRFLEFKEILEETKKFKQRIDPLLKDKKDVNYTQGFHYSRQLLGHIADQKQQKLVIGKMNQDQINELCEVELDMGYEDQNVEQISQHGNINQMFKQWQKLIKFYRNTDSQAQDESLDDQDPIGDDLEDQNVGITPAHYDLLAESITKFQVYRPYQDQQDFGPKFSKQDLIDATSFVRYDVIDKVEQDEAESQQVGLGDNNDEEANVGSDGDDTLNAQGTVKSHEIYKNQTMNMLENFEISYDQSLIGELYQTATNAFKIQLSNHKNNQEVLMGSKQQNDDLIGQEENANNEGESFKTDFHYKSENLKREQELKKQDFESLKRIKQLELQRYKDQQQVQIEEYEVKITESQIKIDYLKDSENTITQSYDKAQTEKNIEVSQYQNEINKIEQDIDLVNDKLQKIKNQEQLSPEAEEQCNLLVQFQKQAENKLQECVDIIQPLMQGQDSKMMAYELQKEFNDYEYQINQKQKQKKKQVDDDNKNLKKEYDNIIGQALDEVEQKRSSQYDLEDQKTHFSRQLEAQMGQIFESQNEKERLIDQKEQVIKELHDIITEKDKINKQVLGLTKQQEQLSKKIINLSRGNQIVHEDKEEIMILLKDVVKELNGMKFARGNIQQYVMNITNQEIREEVIEMLKKYKLIR